MLSRKIFLAYRVSTSSFIQSYCNNLKMKVVEVSPARSQSAHSSLLLSGCGVEQNFGSILKRKRESSCQIFACTSGKPGVAYLPVPLFEPIALAFQSALALQKSFSRPPEETSSVPQ